MDKRSQDKRNWTAPRVMIVSGEASGDLHGGALAEALLKKNPDLDLVGFGGKSMRAAGVDIRFDIKQLGIVGIVEVIYHFRAVIQAYRTALKLMREEVKLLVLIDFPDFNLRLAKAAKGMNIPVVYYVSPQIWAWRSGRIKTIAERVDLMLVVFPFEKEIYVKANVPCEFVGHPLLDEQAQLGISSNSNLHERKASDRKAPTIALLPGSRTREVKALLPAMMAGIEDLSADYPDIQVLIPVAPSLPKDLIPSLVAAYSLPVKLVKGAVYDVFHASDVAVVASGTATLQGALAGTPMIVVYKVSWFSYYLARLLVRVKSIGLANIVADEPFIPELIQADVSSRRICKEIGQLLKNDAARESMKLGLKKVVGRLGKAGASERAALAILRILDRSPQNQNHLKPHQVSA